MSGNRTPLSARWHQMSLQEQLIHHKKEMLLLKNKDKSEAKTLNLFTNDGSFMEKFKLMKDGDKKPTPGNSSNAQTEVKKPSESRISHKDDKHKNDRQRRRSRSHSDSRSSSRSRSRSRSRDRNRRQDRWKRNDHNNRDKHKSHSRWEPSSGRHSRRRSNSPSTPAVEDMVQRKQSRFSSAGPAPVPSVNSMNIIPNHNLPSTTYIQNNPPPNFPPCPLPNLMNIAPPMLNMPPGGPVPPPSMSYMPPSGPVPHPGGPVPPPLNVPPPPLQQNFNMQRFQINPPLPFNRFDSPNFSTPPPGFGDTPFYSNMPPMSLNMIPPPNTMPLHTIPEPKPLEAVKIPPPKPMNLQSIPPPSPICLNQIPKPKELDLHSIPPPQTSIVLSTDNRRRITPAMDGIAKQVAQSGDELETVLKGQSSHDSSTWFLNNPHSQEYKIYRNLVDKYKIDIEEAERQSKVRPEDKYEPDFPLQDDSDCDDDHVYKKFEEKRQTDSERVKKRKSRWSDAPAENASSAPAAVGVPGVASISSLGGLVNIQPPLLNPKLKEKPQLTKVTRSDPGLLNYAATNFGSTALTEEQWTKCEDHYKVSILYQDMMKKRNELEKLAAAGRHKYEYDSDEEVDDHGTWEHKLRMQEMEATKQWANELTRQAEGKHHIGDFLPPDELDKFMQKYTAAKGGREPDLSDYKEFKLKEDNIGFKMLQKLGWSEGQGLGADGSGIVEPVNKGNQRDSNLGLGVDRADDFDKGDDEFDAYRKRMMLAYRFRPNPLNNPRRPYY